MRVIASTVVRESKVGLQLTGRIFEVDAETGTVIATLPVPEPSNPASDDNPRGGIRGGRGITVTPDGVMVANYDGLYVYDRNWRLKETIRHPLFLGLHEIDFDGEYVYMSATAIDAVLRMDSRHKVEVFWDPHEGDSRMMIEKSLAKRVAPLDVRACATPALVDECHLNGVASFGSDLIVNLGKVQTAPDLRHTPGLVARTLLARARAKGRKVRVEFSRTLIIRLSSTGEAEILVERPSYRGLPVHNGQLLSDDWIAYNDSSVDKLRIVSRGEGEDVAGVRIPGRWLRGMFPLGNDEVLVGSAPASIVRVSLPDGRIRGSLRLSDDINEAVHGLIALDDEA